MLAASGNRTHLVLSRWITAVLAHTHSLLPLLKAIGNSWDLWPAVSIPGREFTGILKASGLSKILTKYDKIRLICLCNLYHKSLQMHFSSANTRDSAGQAQLRYTVQRFAPPLVSPRDIIAILSVYPSVCYVPLLYQAAITITSQFFSTSPIILVRYISQTIQLDSSLLWKTNRNSIYQMVPFPVTSI